MRRVTEVPCYLPWSYVPGSWAAWLRELAFLSLA